MNHTPEPWRYDPLEGVVNPHGQAIAELLELANDGDGFRIVAAVNACAGIPTAALESGVVAELRDECERVRKVLANYVVECGKPGTWATEQDDRLARLLAKLEPAPPTGTAEAVTHEPANA